MLQVLGIFIIVCICTLLLTVSYFIMCSLLYVWDKWVVPLAWKVWIWFYLLQYPS